MSKRERNHPIRVCDHLGYLAVNNEWQEDRWWKENKKKVVFVVYREHSAIDPESGLAVGLYQDEEDNLIQSSSWRVVILKPGKFDLTLLSNHPEVLGVYNSSTWGEKSVFQTRRLLPIVRLREVIQSASLTKEEKEEGEF